MLYAVPLLYIEGKKWNLFKKVSMYCHWYFVISNWESNSEFGIVTKFPVVVFDYKWIRKVKKYRNIFCGKFLEGIWCLLGNNSRNTPFRKSGRAKIIPCFVQIKRRWYHLKNNCLNSFWGVLSAIRSRFSQILRFKYIESILHSI